MTTTELHTMITSTLLSPASNPLPLAAELDVLRAELAMTKKSSWNHVLRDLIKSRDGTSDLNGYDLERIKARVLELAIDDNAKCWDAEREYDFRFTLTLTVTGSMTAATEEDVIDFIANNCPGTMFSNKSSEFINLTIQDEDIDDIEVDG